MSTTKIVNKDGTTSELFVTSDIYVSNITFNGSTVSSTTTFKNLTSGGRLIFEVKVNKKKFNKINSMLLEINADYSQNSLSGGLLGPSLGGGMTPSVKYPIKLSVEDSLTSNKKDFRKELELSDSNVYLVDVADIVNSMDTETFYFGLYSDSTYKVYLTNINKPKFYANYTLPGHSVKNGSFVSGEVGMKVGYGINQRFGELLVKRSLYQLDGLLMPLNLELIHNSIRKDEVIQQGMPKGWKLNYHQKLFINSAVIYYLDSNGNYHEFTKYQNTNKFFDKSGLGLKITLLSDGSYQLESGTHSYLLFDSFGKLTTIREQINEDTYLDTTISYDADGKITNITDPMGQMVTISYDQHALEFDCEVRKSIILKKNDLSLLTEIEEHSGRKYNFTYEDSLIKTIISDNGEKSEFSYDNYRRVSRVKDIVCKNGIENILENRAFKYVDDTTKITNLLNVEMEYKYDLDGKVIFESENTSETQSHGVYNKGLSKTYIRKQKDVSMILNSINFVTSANEVNSQPLTFIKKREEFLPETSYFVTVRYKVDMSSNDLTEESKARVVVKLDRESETLDSGIELDLTRDEYTVTNFLIETLDKTINEPQFLLVTNTKSTIYLDYVTIKKIEKSIRKVCLNTTIAGAETFDFWENTLLSVKEEPKTTISYINASEEIQTVEIDLFEEDIKENIKNYHLANGGVFDLYYNHKKDIIENVKDVILFSDSNNPLELKDAILCIVNEIADKKIYTYDCYTSDGDGFKTSYETTIYGNTDNTKFIEYDKFNRVLRDVNYDQTATSYEYDEKGNVIKEISSNHISPLRYTKEYTYQDFKFLKTETTISANQQKATMTYDYNAKGMLETVTMPNGLVYTYTYDEDSLELLKISCSGQNVVMDNNISYEKDLVKKLFNKDNSGYEFGYDKYNMLSSVKSSINTNSNDFMSFEFDFENETTVNTQVYPSRKTKRSVSDKYGNLVQKIDTIGDSIVPVANYYYSNLDSDEINLTLDPNSSEIKKIKSSKLKVATDLLTDTKVTYLYDDTGKLVATNSDSDNIVDTNITYDDIERVIGKEISKNDLHLRSSYAYRGDKIMSSEDVEFVSVEFLDNTTENKLFKYQIEVDELKRIDSEVTTFRRIDFTNPLASESKIKTEYSYQSRDDHTTTNIPNIVSFKRYDYQTVAQNYGNLTYTYDIMSNIVGINDTVNNNSITYEYDLFGRLIRENNQKLNKTTVFNYDVKGNILSKDEYPYTTESLVTTNKTTKNYLYSNEYPDRLVSYNGQTITYDVDGNITSASGKSFTWERGNKLASVTNSAEVATFYRDGEGRLLRKQTLEKDHYYIYDGQTLVAEDVKDIDGNMIYKFTYIYTNNKLVGFMHNSTPYIFLRNTQNDIIGIVNEAGTLIATYVYDAWGNHKVYDAAGNENTNSEFIGNLNPFRYRGYYYDVETGLFWCNSRYYNPEWGRWISPDSIEYLNPQSINGLNLYAYCNNDPVNYYDPSGHLPFLILLLGGLIVTALIITEPTEEVARINSNSKVEYGNISVSGPEINHKEITLFSVEGVLAEEKYLYENEEELYFYISSFSADVGLSYNKNENKFKLGKGFSFFSFGVNIGRFHMSVNFGFCDFIQWGIKI